MIKEIVQFVRTLPEAAFSKNLELKEGLYILLDIDESNGSPILRNTDNNGNILQDDVRVWVKHSELSPFFAKCLQIQTNTLPASPQKIFNPDKKIFSASCSPFGLSFVKKNYQKYNQEQDLVIDQLKNQYFKSADKYIVSCHHRRWFQLFRDYLIKNLSTLLGKIPEFANGKDSLLINIYLKNVDIADYSETYKAYLQENVFNKSEYNIKYGNHVLGISDSLNGFNAKKRFLQHRTGLSKLNYRISEEEALLVWRFFRLQQNKQLPNPTPLFVDLSELELNKDLVAFYQNDKMVSYPQLIKELLRKHNKQLQNFYLLFFQSGMKGSKVIDFDFVPKFQYQISPPIVITEVFKLDGQFSSQSISNVFDLEDKVFNKIFNGHLIQNTNNGVWRKYFDDLETKPQYHLTDTITNLMYQYRKSVYDYVYKSRRQNITSMMFEDMMRSSIIDDIRRDKEFNRDFAIREKLNIWFNLWNFFSQNQNGQNMASRTKELIDRLKVIIEREQEHLRDDDEFAFASGQLLWKILIQNKSATRSHSLLEPFLQKVDPGEFKKAIARSFDMYKHEFVMYPKKYAFDKIMSEVMGYEPNEKNLKNLIHMLLAGYFAESVFDKEKKDNHNQQ